MPQLLKGGGGSCALDKGNAHRHTLCAFPPKQEMKSRGVKVEKAVDDYEAVKKLGGDVDTSGSRFNDAFRIALAENKRCSLA